MYVRTVLKSWHTSCFEVWWWCGRWWKRRTQVCARKGWIDRLLEWRTRRRVKLWMFQKWLPVSGLRSEHSTEQLPLLSEVRPIYIHVYVCVRLRLVGGNRFRSKNQYAAPWVSSFVVRITLYWVSNNQANYEVSTGFRFHKFRPSFLFFLNPSCIQNSGTLKKLIIIAKVLSQFILF